MRNAGAPIGEVNKGDVIVGDVIVRQPAGQRWTGWTWLWTVLLLGWILVLCLLPDPRPLGAPEWAVAAMRKLLGISEGAGRAVATFALRSAGLGLLGLLLALSVSGIRMRWAVITVVAGGPMLSIACQWINYGYFPLFFQAQIGAASVIVGGLAGLALRHSVPAKIGFVVITGGLFLWGTATGISDNVDEVARITGHYVLSHVEDVPKGEDGFVMVVQESFRFAADNSHRTDAVQTNKAVIVALGVIMGEQRVAKVAHRNLTGQFSKEISAIRSRVRLQGRSDLPQHFWVSAALTVLSDADRSITVGITKELMDATPGGSGFSFVDLMADRAGTLFASAATKNDDSARLMQMLLRGEITTSDFLPPIDGIPEGLSMDEFQQEYGGLRGKGTAKIVAEIERRLSECKLLNLSG